MIDEYTRRLMSIGVPFSEAFGQCVAHYKAGDLPGFVRGQEEAYRLQCAAYAAEIID